MAPVRVRRGCPAALAPEAAQLVWEAFAGKLVVVLGPEDKALRYLQRALDPRFAFAATDEGGTLVGVAGIKVPQGGFIGGTARDLREVYGPWGSLWRGALLTLLERGRESGTLMMDGICVRQDWRGHGVGRQLLDAVLAEAAAGPYRYVRLDVVDTNPRAAKLYEAVGFRPQGAQRLGPLRHIFGFRRSTTMIRAVP